MKVVMKVVQTHTCTTLHHHPIPLCRRGWVVCGVWVVQIEKMKKGVVRF
jgi:hypothetical protein